MALDCESSDMYWLAISEIEAQEVLIQMRIADFPNLKTQDRRAFHSKMHKIAFPAREDESDKKTTSETYNLIRGLLGNG